MPGNDSVTVFLPSSCRYSAALYFQEDGGNQGLMLCACLACSSATALM